MLGCLPACSDSSPLEPALIRKQGDRRLAKRPDSSERVDRESALEELPAPEELTLPEAPGIGDRCLIFLKDTNLLEPGKLSTMIETKESRIFGRLKVLNEDWLALDVRTIEDSSRAILWIPRSSVSAVLMPEKQ